MIFFRFACQLRRERRSCTVASPHLRWRRAADAHHAPSRHERRRAIAGATRVEPSWRLVRRRRYGKAVVPPRFALALMRLRPRLPHHSRNGRSIFAPQVCNRKKLSRCLVATLAGLGGYCVHRRVACSCKERAHLPHYVVHISLPARHCCRCCRGRRGVRKHALHVCRAGRRTGLLHAAGHRGGPLAGNRAPWRCRAATARACSRRRAPRVGCGYRW